MTILEMMSDITHLAVSNVPPCRETVSTSPTTEILQDDTSTKVEIFQNELSLEISKEKTETSEKWTIPDYIPSTAPETIDKLVAGTLSYLLPDFEKAKSTLGALTENQRILIETVQQENKKFTESKALDEVTAIMEKAKMYQNKLLNIKKEMVVLHEKSAKLKKRTLKIQQQKQKEALLKEQDRERMMEKERLLIAKTSRTSHNTL